MSETAPKTELMRSLGRLVRGLSALFWGLPIALVVCVQTVNTNWLGSLGHYGLLAERDHVVRPVLELLAFLRRQAKHVADDDNWLRH